LLGNVLSFVRGFDPHEARLGRVENVDLKLDIYAPAMARDQAA
jgi:hypothetical protein